MQATHTTMLSLGVYSASCLIAGCVCLADGTSQYMWLQGRQACSRPCCLSAGRTVLEALEDFPSAQVPLQWLLQIVPRLQPRYFSIASSQAAHPGQVHILAALVDYQTPHRRRKRGVCSAWLAGLQAGMPDARVIRSKCPLVPLCTFLCCLEL